MDASAGDVIILVVVVGLRLGVPLLVFRYPLPAILAALVIDGVDQTVFQSWLTDATWASVADEYQGYDKALDVYYLTLAYIATMRNWTNPAALRWAQGLWLYRLVGVTIFEVLHDASDVSSWRWLLLVFPNTFEYFFIAYEAVRLRWNPGRLSPRHVAALVAFIWIVIKLPQEWWIHVAELDVTDVLGGHPWLLPVLGVVFAAVVAVAWWAVQYRLPPMQWRWWIAAPPLPPDLDTAAERAAYRAVHWKLFDSNLLEKVVLVSLACEVFAQILPGSTATVAQVSSAVGVLVVINAATGLAFARRHHWIEGNVAAFATVCAINAFALETLSLLSPRFQLNHALFFVLLISLIVLLYDKYRPIRNERLAVAWWKKAEIDA